MNCVMITSGKRTDLLNQSLISLKTNAANWENHTLTLVFDGASATAPMIDTLILNGKPQGASHSRNSGAASIPIYRRHKHILFLDDDVFLVNRWDEALLELASVLPRHLISLYGHPFNVEEEKGSRLAKFPLVISSVCMFMDWAAWDEIGYWDLPGGPGASEDYSYCQRAQKLGYGFAVSKPHRLIHCGLISSRGDKIVGHGSLVEQNNQLIELHGIQGKVFING